MKKILFISLSFILVLLVACNDKFLDRSPQTGITTQNFFTSVSDLQTYTWQFYDYWGPTYWDIPSDNTTFEKGSIKSLLLGSVTPDNAGGWNWSQLRTINYFINNYHRASGDALSINHYGAMGRFARAKFYINMVKTYSDVPWYSKDLSTTDKDLYKGRDTREMVVDSIISDLEFASKNLFDISHKTIISKWAAYAELSRFCLYEGSYRKYHAGETDLHVTKTPDYFFNKSITASEAIMGSGDFNISNTGKPAEDYANLFNGGTDLNANSEIIMFTHYEKGKRTNGTELVLQFQNGISRTMADTYLYTDGTFVPKDVTDTMRYENVFKNRDIRMKQSIMFPGYIQPNEAPTPHKLPISKTAGYGQIKFMPKVKGNNWDGYETCTTDLPLYRYAEVLLNDAEAKAELGTLTQTDLNNTINKLRARAAMPNLNMAPPVDPILAALYSNITSAQKAELLEIRRERNVELFAEGFRYDDLFRWKLGKIYELPQQGIYVPASGFVDYNNDGIPDYFITNDASKIPANITTTYPGITVQNTSDPLLSFYLEFGDHGHVMFKGEKNGLGTFIEPKYYYSPIPTSQITLNPNLKQIFGWGQ